MSHCSIAAKKEVVQCGVVMMLLSIAANFITDDARLLCLRLGALRGPNWRWIVRRNCGRFLAR
jgi:hypothetical protein